MKALKALVIGMGILIVAGIGLVGYGLARGKPQPNPQAMGATPIENPAPEAKAPRFSGELPVPRGAKLEQMTAAGDRIVLRFSSPEGDKLVLLDTHTGQLAGTVTLVPDSH